MVDGVRFGHASERNAVDAGENIDPYRRDAHLKGDIRFGKRCFADVVEGSSE